MYILCQKIAPRERQFSWHLSNKARRLLYMLAKFCQNVVSLLTSITMMLERAHARSHSRRVNVFAKLKKKSVAGKLKNVLLSEFRWLNNDG